MEVLLGIDLQIDEEKLNPRISEAIAKQINEHKLRISELDPQHVDWGKLIENAAFRRPPFSEGTEKGFKDAIILETFMQVAHSLPRSGCRVVFLCGDELLRGAAQERCQSITNVHTAASLDDLENMLNALASHLSEEQIEILQNKGSKLFFQEGDQSTIYFKLDVNKRVEEALVSSGHKNFPEGTRSWNNTYISNSIFVSKQGQRVTFKARISRLFSDAIFEVHSAESLKRPFLTWTTDKVEGALKPQAQLGTILGSLAPTQPSRTGRLHFQVTWEATVLRTGALSAPKIVDVSFQEIKFTESELAKAVAGA